MMRSKEVSLDSSQSSSCDAASFFTTSFPMHLSNFKCDMLNDYVIELEGNKELSPLHARKSRFLRIRSSKSFLSKGYFVATISVIWLSILVCHVQGFIPDRARVINDRKKVNLAKREEGPNINKPRIVDFDENGKEIHPAIGGSRYRSIKSTSSKPNTNRRHRKATINTASTLQQQIETKKAGSFVRKSERRVGDPTLLEKPVFADDFGRHLSSQLTGCCTKYSAYTAEQMCALYGKDCDEVSMSSHDSTDEECDQAGLSFIGVSFSVNTAYGNPYSYQLCDQWPMENIIDRDYQYVMSMDEDGWLVGGGYKTFDYSGKMPYIDSSHTELLRVGSLDTSKGGTSISQVYSAMTSVTFSPLSMYPEYVKGGGGHNSGDDDKGVPSGDITLVVSVVETFTENDSYSDYEMFLDNLFDAMDAAGSGPCMDDHDTDPHVSMNRGVKFKSSYHEKQYYYSANLEVAVWQSMYPKGVVIGSTSYESFPPNNRRNPSYMGYGNLYFFYDRANITTFFPANRDLSATEKYYATYWSEADEESIELYYESTTKIDFDYAGSGDNGGDYEHNPYNWKGSMAIHDMTDGWDLPPNCDQEGETFFGVPLSRASDSKLTSTGTFQESFDFETLIDRNYTYVLGFGTNHGWLVGEEAHNARGSIVDKDTAHIPIFYTGTTNPDAGGMALSKMIKIGKAIDFGTLYLKPAFVFIDDEGTIKLQFEADASSALGYLYNNLCEMMGISWNYESPSNEFGYFTNCAMHAAGDRAKYGCGPNNGNTGGFCPQMTIAYKAGFQSEEAGAEYLAICNNYVDYWRSLYPSGVAVGTNSFCSPGGCMALFLNRYDVYTVFQPGLSGSWVEYNGGSSAPTISPAPTMEGGCDNPKNHYLDKCFRKSHTPKPSLVAWDSLGSVGQLSIFLVTFMATTLSISIFLARARKRKRRGESYAGFFMRDMKRKKKRKKGKKLRKKGNKLEEDLISNRFDDDDTRGAPPPRPGRTSSRGGSRSGSRSGRSRSRSKSRGMAASRPPRGAGVPSGERPPSSRRERSRSRGRNSEKSVSGSSVGRSTSRSVSRARSVASNSRNSGSVSRERSRSRSRATGDAPRRSSSNRRQLV